MPTRTIDFQQLRDLADAIETEMKRLGIWSAVGASKQKAPTGAFGAGAMSFEMWLQTVFVPRLREAGPAGAFPSHGTLAIAAIRHLDGLPGIERLTRLLSQVDRLVETNA